MPRATDVDQGSYRNRFIAAPGPLHAQVVNQGDEPIHAVRDGRVRIQFG